MRHARRRLLVWLLGSAVGAFVVALPDGGPRVLSLSETHGPSWLDLAGIAVVVAAWLPVPHLFWSQRAALRDAMAVLVVLAALVTVGAAVVVLSIATDAGATWAVGVVLLVAAQLAALATVDARTRHR